MSTQLIQSPPLLHPAANRPALQHTPWRRAGLALWRALERVGQSRARSELQRLAQVHELVNPELAAQLRQAARRVG
jgi:hypothetical protein